MHAQFAFRDLEVWKQGMDLVEACYKASATFPKSEMYGLTRQLRRASTSIPTNLADAHGRRTTRAYLNHVSVAIGSQAELETCLELARRLGLLPQASRIHFSNRRNQSADSCTAFTAHSIEESLRSPPIPDLCPHPSNARRATSGVPRDRRRAGGSRCPTSDRVVSRRSNRRSRRSTATRTAGARIRVDRGPSRSSR
jgi:four helix bundle protein